VPKITIVMPAYRAEHTLGKTVADIPAGFADELILVDDASPDHTVEVARSLGGIKVFVHETNRGYGGNQKTCYTEALRAGADIIVLLHPDYQYDPKAVPLLVAPILAGDADLTFGSRFAGLSDPRSGGMPMYRYMGNRLTTMIENLLLGSRFTEMHSGMRAYTRQALLQLPFRNFSNDFVFDSQLVADAVTTGLRAVEVPIPTRYTKESSSIAVWPSVRYIAGSIVWTARRAIERGRRGKRNPVRIPPRARGKIIASGEPVALACFLCGDYRARRPSPGAAAAQCLRCGVIRSLDPPSPDAAGHAVSESDYAWMFDHAAAYAVRTDTLMVVGPSDPALKGAAAHAGWSVVMGRDDTGPGFVSAVLAPYSLERLPDPLAALRGLTKVIDPEGLLLMAVRGAAASPDPTGMVTAFTSRTLRATLAAAGFKMIEWARMPSGRDAFVVARPEAAIEPAGPLDLRGRSRAADDEPFA
jgi:glycosyltransferase involved in cell wall biosynthesis